MPALKPCIKATCCSNVTANTCSSALAVHAIYVVISGAGCQLKRCNIQRVRVFLKPCKCSSIAAPCFFAPFLFLVQKSFFLFAVVNAGNVGRLVQLLCKPIRDNYFAERFQLLGCKFRKLRCVMRYMFGHALHCCGVYVGCAALAQFVHDSISSICSSCITAINKSSGMAFPIASASASSSLQKECSAACISFFQSASCLSMAASVQRSPGSMPPVLSFTSASGL